jgi:hypothetical protein
MRWTLMIGVLSLACAGAWGQVGLWAGPTADKYAPAATMDEVESLARDAGMDADAAEAARSLVTSYAAATRRAALAMQRTVERNRLTHDMRERDVLRVLWETADAERYATHGELSKSLIADLRSLVPAGADDAWNTFERARRRRMLLGTSARIGASADLIAVARAEQVPMTPEVRDLLAGYALELDRLLLARVPIAADSDRRLAALEEKGDTPGAETLFNAVLEADCAIIRLNRSTAARLVALTPPDNRGRLRDRLLTARWAYCRTETPLRRKVETLIQSGRLDGARRQQLEEAARRFDEQSRAVDERNLTRAEETECGTPYARVHDNDAMNANREADYAWYEAGRKLELELLDALDSVATPDDLDSLEP